MKYVHLLVVGLAILLCIYTAAATPWTPVEWKEKGKLEWVRDQNKNYVDDLIDKLSKTSKVNVIVDLNTCVGNPNKSELIDYLKRVGKIDYVGKYLSFVTVKDVRVSDVYNIAARPEVAMVELATKEKWLQEPTQAAKIEHSSAYNGQTLEDRFNWPTSLNGNGVNIAFLDSGVGDSYNSYFVHGYNALTDREENPPPNSGIDHATWMASWVFGSGGVAPDAGLIDVKVGSDSVDSAAVMRALEKMYEKRDDWNVNVVVMMFSGSYPLDGKEAREQLIDMLAGKGIVVVAASGGNERNSIVSGPGAATRAIGVSTANMTTTVNRADDVANIVRGPRADDGDEDKLDELKPEVVMPTGGRYAVSNSIATALTSGLVALILQHNPDLQDFDNKASGSVKDLLIRSAEPKGTPDTTIRYPRDTPTWDRYWGFGEIDAFEAFRMLDPQSELGTDLTFLGFDNSQHPNDPWYYSHAVQTESERNGRNIVAGVDDVIYARIYNNGSRPAHNVKVSFGFYPFTAGVPKFYDIGSVIVDEIRPGEAKEVHINWTPPSLGGEHHGCILVTIDYGLDTKFSGMSNFAQKNIRIQYTSSPAVFTFRVENPLPKAAEIRLVVTAENEKNFNRWKVTLSDTKFFMRPYDCAKIVKAKIDPTSAVKPGEEAVFFVTAYANDGKQVKNIGGVALKVIKAKLPIIRPIEPIDRFPIKNPLPSIGR